MSRQKDVRKARETREPELPPTPMVSGKLVIITIVTLAVLGAGFSWWFRYTSTVRAARFWGRDSVQLIRDAPRVHLISLRPFDSNAEHAHSAGKEFADHYHTPGGLWQVVDRIDVSEAHGIVHLRNELLLDRSVQEEPGRLHATEDWQHALEFRTESADIPLVVFLSGDCRRLLRYTTPQDVGYAVTAEKFADGLKEVFAEWHQAIPPATN